MPSSALLLLRPLTPELWRTWRFTGDAQTRPMDGGTAHQKAGQLTLLGHVEQVCFAYPRAHLFPALCQHTHNTHKAYLRKWQCCRFAHGVNFWRLRAHAYRRSASQITRTDRLLQS